MEQPLSNITKTQQDSSKATELLRQYNDPLSTISPVDYARRRRKVIKTAICFIVFGIFCLVLLLTSNRDDYYAESAHSSPLVAFLGAFLGIPYGIYTLCTIRRRVAKGVRTYLLWLHPELRDISNQP